MPDSIIPTAAAVPSFSPAGIVSDYRSPLIGQLVAARAKATKEIKTIIKDKKADIPNKQGGRGYAYSYADLAGVMEAVEDALAAQEMALFQTIQERGNRTVLITTLAHSSDQWISSEVSVSSPAAGPQVFGSSLTYMRRYSALAILGIAPDTDDDGKAAQERADQARQKPQDRVEPPGSSTNHPPKAANATQRPPGGSGDPQRIPMPADAGGFRIREWLDQAKAAMNGQSEDWRRRWLDLHEQEMADLRSQRPDWADRVEAAAIAPDLAAAE
jgi:hypothetical protein